jgi:hypothetical protein
VRKRNFNSKIVDVLQEMVTAMAQPATERHFCVNIEINEKMVRI